MLLLFTFRCLYWICVGFYFVALPLFYNCIFQFIIIIFKIQILLIFSFGGSIENDAQDRRVLLAKRRAKALQEQRNRRAEQPANPSVAKVPAKNQYQRLEHEPRQRSPPRQEHYQPLAREVNVEIYEPVRQRPGQEREQRLIGQEREQRRNDREREQRLIDQEREQRRNDREREQRRIDQEREERQRIFLENQKAAQRNKQMVQQDLGRQYDNYSPPEVTMSSIQGCIFNEYTDEYSKL